MASTPVRDRPILTSTFESVATFIPSAGSVYFYGTFEQRSEHSDAWRQQAHDVTFVRLEERERNAISADGGADIALRDMDGLKQFVSAFARHWAYIDVTGLSHHVWAPLLRACWELGLRVFCVYVEPRDYRYNQVPTEGQIFDLSERIDGIAPLPGFASFVEPREEEACFVPLLGFEGTRLKFLLEQVQPQGGKIFPVIGVPGFRAEYPFHTYHGNVAPLLDSRAWKDVRFARANCPFSLFYALEDIRKDHPQDHIQIAPIGTKPHAVGAVMFSLASYPGSSTIELVYDHPKRKVKRTEGAAHCLVYPVSDFLPPPVLNG